MKRAIEVIRARCRSRSGLARPRICRLSVLIPVDVVAFDRIHEYEYAA
jgi:hypothetical protein